MHILDESLGGYETGMRRLNLNLEGSYVGLEGDPANQKAFIEIALGIGVRKEKSVRHDDGKDSKLCKMNNRIVSGAVKPRRVGANDRRENELDSWRQRMV